MNQPCLVIMAAGMGSRFGGPKQTTPVDEYGHFLLHYSLFDAYRAGFRKAVFVVKEDTAEEFRESVGPAVAAAFDALAKLLGGLLLDDEHDLAEARAVGVKERIVQQKMAVLIHGRRLLRASEAAAHTGGHDDQTGLMHTPRSSISQRV